MMLQVFSVYDCKACAYARPFFLPRQELGVRAFEGLISEANSDVSRWPDDYSLYLLGSFDDHSGKFESLREPIFLHKATEFVANSAIKELAKQSLNKENIK